VMMDSTVATTPHTQRSLCVLPSGTLKECVTRIRFEHFGQIMRTPVLLILSH